MPLLSAIDAISPAWERMKSMLRPFRLKTWLKIGFIGWLAGGATSSANFNYNTPSFPGGQGAGVGKDAEQILRSWLHEYLLLIVLIVAVVMAVAFVFLYLSCRFRFILFDSVLRRDAQIGRGWAGYSRPAHRYLGFLVSFLVISLAVISFIVGLPLWRAYKSGVFQAENPLPAILRVLVPVLLGVFLFAIVSAIVSSLANDFGVPLLALDDMTVGDAWSVLRQMIAAEPWAFAGYLGMKFVLSLAAGAIIAIALLVLLIPGVILVLVGVGVAKALGPVAGIILAVVGVLAAIAIGLILTMLVTAPVAVFFTSYSFYFFAGRYPKLGALLWPQQPTPPPPFSTGVPAPQGSM